MSTWIDEAFPNREMDKLPIASRDRNYGNIIR